MAMNSGFFNAVENNGSYDREYGAAFFTALMKATFKNGITPGSFAASVGDGLTVNLTAGKGFVDGVFFYDDSDSTVTCTSASGTRTDLIVAKLNTAARTVTLEVKAGTTTVATGEVAVATVTVTGSAVTAVQNVAATNYGAVCSDAERVGGHKIYVQQAAPTDAREGDLWFGW